MYCPNCKAEYRQGYTRCADCDVELVEELPEEASGGSSYSFDPDDFSLLDPVCILVEARELDAEIALSVLRAHGLRAYLARPTEAYRIAETRVMVHPDDADEAMQLLEVAHEQGDGGEDIDWAESTDSSESEIPYEEASDDPYEIPSPLEPAGLARPLAAPSPGPWRAIFLFLLGAIAVGLIVLVATQS